MATANNNKSANEIQALKFEVRTSHYSLTPYIVVPDETVAARLCDG